jgi:hypothetical protein
MMPGQMWPHIGRQKKVAAIRRPCRPIKTQRIRGHQETCHLNPAGPAKFRARSKKLKENEAFGRIAEAARGLLPGAWFLKSCRRLHKLAQRTS